MAVVRLDLVKVANSSTLLVRLYTRFPHPILDQWIGHTLTLVPPGRPVTSFHQTFIRVILTPMTPQEAGLLVQYLLPGLKKGVSEIIPGREIGIRHRVVLLQSVADILCWTATQRLGRVRMTTWSPQRDQLKEQALAILIYTLFHRPDVPSSLPRQMPYMLTHAWATVRISKGKVRSFQLFAGILSASIEKREAIVRDWSGWTRAHIPCLVPASKSVTKKRKCAEETSEIILIQRLKRWNQTSRVTTRRRSAQPSLSPQIQQPHMPKRSISTPPQGVIQRIANLQYERPRSWIEERLVQQMQERPRTLMWVKGHQGVQGNEKADERARREVKAGKRERKAGIATPWGIKQEFPIYPRAPAHLSWSPEAVKGLTYMVTDKGPQQQWLWEIGKADTQWCVCDGWTPQNAAHLLGCSWVGDGKGRTYEMIWDDEKWCEAVYGFIR